MARTHRHIAGRCTTTTTLPRMHPRPWFAGGFVIFVVTTLFWSSKVVCCCCCCCYSREFQSFSSRVPLRSATPAGSRPRLFLRRSDSAQHSFTPPLVGWVRGGSSSSRNRSSRNRILPTNLAKSSSLSFSTHNDPLDQTTELPIISTIKAATATATTTTSATSNETMKPATSHHHHHRVVTTTTTTTTLDHQRFVSLVGKSTSLVVSAVFAAVLAYQRDALMVSFFLGAISNGT